MGFSFSIMFLQVSLLVLIVAFAVDARPSYIIGGDDAAVGEFPWQGSLQAVRNSDGYAHHMCGCSLINARFAVTAAHCLFTYDGWLPFVAFGINNLDDPNKKMYRVKNYFWHKNWDQSVSLEWDIATLEFYEDVEFTDKIQPIELSSSPPQEGATAIISGWGTSGWNGNTPLMPNKLQKTNPKIQAESYCKDVFGRWFTPHSNVCIHTGYSSSCFGDSGGPLVIYDEETGKYILHGVTSFGVNQSEKCNPYWPQVYTKVSYYKEWIESHSQVN